MSAQATNTASETTERRRLGENYATPVNILGLDRKRWRHI